MIGAIIGDTFGRFARRRRGGVLGRRVDSERLAAKDVRTSRRAVESGRRRVRSEVSELKRRVGKRRFEKFEKCLKFGAPSSSSAVFSFLSYFRSFFSFDGATAKILLDFWRRVVYNRIYLDLGIVRLFGGAARFSFYKAARLFRANASVPACYLYSSIDFKEARQ